MSPMRTVQMTLDQSVGTLILPGARAANGGRGPRSQQYVCVPTRPFLYGSRLAV